MDPWRNITSLNHTQIKDLQNKRLAYFVNHHVYPFSPHYRKVFDQNKINPRQIRTVDDLKYIPFANKIDLVNKENPLKYKDFILQPDAQKIRQFWPKDKLLNLALAKTFKGQDYVMEMLGREFRPVFMTFTTGTTSAPVPFTYSRYDINNLNLSGSRMVKLFDIKSDERIMNIFPFAPHLAFWQVFFGALEADIFALSTGGGKVLGTDGNLMAMLRSQPAVVLGVPSYVYHLVRYAQEKGADLSFIKKVVLGAAKVTVAYKQKLTEMLAAQGARNVRIFGTYGFTEARAAWAECPTENNISSGYHLYPDKEIFEVVGADGIPKREGEDGELVYTPLDARASVVMRWRTGDFVKGGVRYGTCPYCGRTTLLLSSDITRMSDTKDLNLSKVKGTLVNLNNFANVLNEIPQIDEWQVELRKHNNDPFESDEVVVYITTKGGANDGDCAALIRDKLIGATEVAPNDIKFIPLAEMVKRLELETANKEKRILDIRPKG